MLPDRFRLGLGSGEALNEHVFGDRWPEADARLEMLEEAVVTVGPDREAIEAYREPGGRGPVTGGLKVCWGEDRDACVKTVHRMWPNEALGGELAQILPSPRHFEQAARLVTEEQIGASVPCGPDPEEHLAAIRAYVDAGFDEIYVGQIGSDHDGFVDFYAREILPRFTA